MHSFPFYRSTVKPFHRSTYATRYMLYAIFEPNAQVLSTKIRKFYKNFQILLLFTHQQLISSLCSLCPLWLTFFSTKRAGSSLYRETQFFCACGTGVPPVKTQQCFGFES